MVAVEQYSEKRSKQFTRLMQAGREAYEAGNPREAHHYWQQAAMLCPVDEQVWMALLQVVRSKSDRLTCLRNILALNPNNLQAQRQLKLEEMEEVLDKRKQEYVQASVEPAPQTSESPRWLLYALVIGIGFFVLYAIFTTLL